jgi:hypothetical protein
MGVNLNQSFRIAVKHITTTNYNMADQEQQLLYVGPNSVKLGLWKLKNYTGFSEQVAQAIDAHPALNLLFIPLEDFPAKRAEVLNGTNGTIQHAIQQLIADEVL